MKIDDCSLQYEDKYEVEQDLDVLDDDNVGLVAKRVCLNKDDEQVNMLVLLEEEDAAADGDV